MTIGVAIVAVGLGGLAEARQHDRRCRSRAASYFRVCCQLATALRRDDIEDPAYREKLARLEDW
jgi:hypothetical protein